MRWRLARWACVVGLLAACKASTPMGGSSEVPVADAAASNLAKEDGSVAVGEEIPSPPHEAEVDAGGADPDSGVGADISSDRAEEILFAEPAGNSVRRATCPTSAAREDRISCLLALRYDADPAAAKIAVELFDRTGDVAGTHPDVMIDGGFRGRIHLVPELALGSQRRHLAWVAEATRDYGDFFAGLERKATATVGYRSRSLVLRFFRSEKRTTPSAYALGWSVSYNVAGSLNTSADAVRETLFHEIFHLNDAAHGDWSVKALGPTYDAIVARCGANSGCLRPYAPSATVVRGGTYYAFQPGNGVGEYAAELALRYYQETRAALVGRPLAASPFRCGTAENARAWGLLVAEFFGGVDLGRACPLAAD